MEEIKYNKELAENYNNYHKQSVNHFANQINMLRHFISNNNALDVGCGSGRLLSCLNKHNTYGIEYSENMFNAAKRNGINNITHGDASDLKLMKTIIELMNIEKLYFSFSLHQIIKNKYDQKEYIDSLFSFGIQKILLITTVIEDFGENLITKYVKKAYDEDAKRFMSIKELYNNFNVEDCFTHKIYIKHDKQGLFEKIRNKYISTLQLLSNDEIEEIISNIDKDYPGQYVTYPDFYTYVTLTP